MPKGPQGQKRPGDVIGAAIMVARIATGEIEETTECPRSPAADAGHRGGKKRAERTTPERRAEIAKAAAEARWKPK